MMEYHLIVCEELMVLEFEAEGDHTETDPKKIKI